MDSVATPALAMVTHDSEPDLRRNAAGQIAVAAELSAPLIAVDNGSKDGTSALLRGASRGGPLELVELGSNRGFAVAANAAFERAGERDVMLFNPDLALRDAGVVRALAAHLATQLQAGIAAPRLVGPDGEVQPSARRLTSLPAMLGSLPAARRVKPLVRAYERYLAPSYSPVPSSVGWVIGAAMLVRRRAFEQVGGFDEGFFLYMEDADLCLRLNRAGWTVDYLPDIRIAHGYARASSATGATVVSSPARRRHFASLARYWRKHPRAIVGGER